ncbi:acyltransferase family protein [Rhizobium sp. RAF36]|jgi:peptidoglycan/LPS O-acetylase OafA/YrhL|uniref:acyltransferase family protein n=1 Tax=Rhizobium sp. RAF36 TaxID=3233055 RepID=UPI000DD53989
MLQRQQGSGSAVQHGYRSDIDGLRAVAVLSVVIFHAFPTWLPGGLVGVDIFFVISGYLISGHILQQLHDDRFSIFDFYSRRIRRIFPALIAVLLFCLCVGWIALSAADNRELGEHVAGGAGFVANLLFWFEIGSQKDGGISNPLLHLWSLGVEEQFYIVWPLAAWIAWRRGMNVIKTIAVVALVSMIANLVIVYLDRTTAFYLPITRFWELLAGAALAELERSRGNLSKPAANAAAISGIVLLVLSFALIREKQAFPGIIAAAPVLGAVLVIAAGRTAFLKQAIFSNPIAIAVGLISYPLYLWHWPLLSFGYIVEKDTPALSVRIGLLAAGFALAALTYLLIEKPIRFGRFRKSAVAVPLFAVMTAIGVAGYWVAERDGLPGSSVRRDMAQIGPVLQKDGRHATRDGSPL